MTGCGPSGDPNFDPAGTSWEGTIGNSHVEFTLEDDGTIYFAQWDDLQGVDEPGDTWVVDGTTITLSISYSPTETTVQIVDYVGPRNAERLELKAEYEGGTETASLTRL